MALAGLSPSVSVFIGCCVSVTVRYFVCVLTVGVCWGSACKRKDRVSVCCCMSCMSDVDASEPVSEVNARRAGLTSPQPGRN